MPKHQSSKTLRDSIGRSIQKKQGEAQSAAETIVLSRAILQAFRHHEDVLDELQLSAEEALQTAISLANDANRLAKHSVAVLKIAAEIQCIDCLLESPEASMPDLQQRIRSIEKYIHHSSVTDAQRASLSFFKTLLCGNHIPENPMQESSLLRLAELPDASPEIILFCAQELMSREGSHEVGVKLYTRLRTDFPFFPIYEDALTP